MLRYSTAVFGLEFRLNVNNHQHFRRLLSTSSSFFAKDVALNRQAKIMGKLFGNRVTGSKKHWYPSDSSGNLASQHPVTFNASNFGKRQKQQGKATIRRMTVLNKLFMTHVSDLLATGEASEKIIGKGLQISRVKISSDFAVVNVFWVASGDSGGDDELEKELHRCSGLVRHELSQLRLMGEVPRISFVRDKTYANLAQVENILRKCEICQDNELIDATHQLQRDLNINATAIDSVEQKEYVNEEDKIPDMRHDVLGLDHRGIMMKILTKMKKSKQAWETHDRIHQDELVSEFIPAANKSESALVRINRKLEEAEATSVKFDKFLAQKRERKNTPERKKFQKSDQVLDDESDAFFDDKLFYDGDYIDEELEDKQK